jgi:DNA-binding response OmpR family regulator
MPGDGLVIALVPEVHKAESSRSFGGIGTVQVAVVVLDLGRDGTGLAQAVEIRCRPDAPRLTAFRDRLPEQDPRELLFDAYLMKPCPPEHLVLAVKAVLQRRV